MGEVPRVHTVSSTFIECYEKELRVTEGGAHEIPYPIISLSFNDVTYHFKVDSDVKFEQLWNKLMELVEGSS